ncbi:MAG: D-amino-acid transaminase [Pseudomonadota bacterium]
MPRIAYVNGAYSRLADASTNIEDRGYQFSDGVYEVCLVVDGKYWDMAGHIARLWRSLEALSIRKPIGDGALKIIMAKVLRLNKLRDALVYIQVSRGVAPRNHPFPDAADPTLVVTARPFDLAKSNATAGKGVALVTQPDIRWGRVDVKSVSLLPNVLAKQAAKRVGAAEALLIKDGKVTEGASSNAWILTAEGVLVTHPLGHEILGGITRQTTLDRARELQIPIEERAFTLAEAHEAQEVFITSATNIVTPVVRIDDHIVGDGAPGPVALRLREAYIDFSRRDA